MDVTAYDLAERFVGLREAKGPTSNAHVLAMLQLDAGWPVDDEVPWCSAFANYIAWLLRLPRSKNLAARSWLQVGSVVERWSENAQRGFDVVILKRGGGDQPGPEVLAAAGHVGFLSGIEVDADLVWVLGGNQNDSVSLACFKADRVLGVRRLR
jgi:uncharacterized protein (TIGR02594 family)